MEERVDQWKNEVVSRILITPGSLFHNTCNCLTRVMNGVSKVRPPTQELNIIVFSPFVLHYINEVTSKYYGFSLLDSSKGLLLASVRVTPGFPPVEFSHTFSTCGT